MSSFYCGDMIQFKDDPDITGVIDVTWSDVENEPACSNDHLYVHMSMPTKVWKTWRKEKRLLPGYVIVEFMLPQDGFCLISESSLYLYDRASVLGDIVKRKASDQQSGRVLSASAECTLEPVCSLEEYASNSPIIAQGHQPSQGPYMRARSSTKPELHGFPDNEQAKALPSCETLKLTVPAAELRAFQDFQQEDFIIYQDWIGRIGSVLDEVTVRLTNGSVVLVEEAEELELPYYIPGTSSYRLTQRLDRAGYYQCCHECQKSRLINKAGTNRAEYFYPGQHVRAKKGNLRRGRWIFGAYDPYVEPQGIVVHVRTVELEVNWLFPNFLDKDQLPGPAPPNVLDTNVLERGQIRLLDKSRLPRCPLAKTMQNATPETGTEYGSLIRFKDPAGAALKYAQTFHRKERADTQGYDMNVLHVISTRNRVLVQWQDGSMSEEAAVSLTPFLCLDQNDVWPGDRVSLKVDEYITGTGLPRGNAILHARTIGVVQTVNAAERLARVRWFQNASFKIDLTEDFQKLGALPSSTYGTMTNMISEISLYDIAAYNALDPKLGDVAIARPATVVSQPQLIDHSGEVVELCLDGEVIVRCYAASEPQDIKVATSDLTIAETADSEEYRSDTDGSLDEDEEDEDRGGSSDASTADEEMDDFNNEASPEPINIQVEYEGGKNMDAAGDEDAWSTDNEVPNSSTTSSTRPGSNEDVVDPALQEEDTESANANQTLDDIRLNALDAPDLPCVPPSAPFPFSVLEASPPTDHHYLGEHPTTYVNVAKRANKEHRIMLSSLPNGIFVRTWENRLDLLRVLIVGPVGTPYEHAPFLFDLLLPPSFPDEPPKVFFHSWTEDLGRVNPNLYEDGKVCLSLLGTWPADGRNEGWSTRSTILQVLVSILGLILVKEPYYSK